MSDLATISDDLNSSDEVTTERCECCGQRIRKLNPHHLDRQKLHVLLDLWKARHEGAEWCKMLEGEFMEVPLASGRVRWRTAYLARAHAMRLAWFGLAEWHGHRTGEWRITAQGLAFLQGAVTVPRTIWCRDGEVVKVSEQRWNITDARLLLLDKEYWDRYPEWQRTLSELESV